MHPPPTPISPIHVEAPVRLFLAFILVFIYTSQCLYSLRKGIYKKKGLGRWWWSCNFVSSMEYLLSQWILRHTSSCEIVPWYLHTFSAIWLQYTDMLGLLVVLTHFNSCCSEYLRDMIGHEKPQYNIVPCTLYPVCTYAPVSENIPLFGASRPDGIPYGFADFFVLCFFCFLFFFVSFLPPACSVSTCCEENNRLGWNFAEPYLWTCFRSR